MFLNLKRRIKETLIFYVIVLIRSKTTIIILPGCDVGHEQQEFQTIVNQSSAIVFLLIVRIKIQ